MKVLLAPAVSFRDHSTSIIFTAPLRPPQIYSHQKRIIPSLNPTIKNCSFKSFSFLYVKVSLNDGIHN